MEGLSNWIPVFAGKRILVLGDICLDEYIIGKASRLSREAPVPVLEFQKRLFVPGAAANPASNIRSLGAEVLIAGVVGDDYAGKVVKERLESQGIDINGIMVDGERETTLKTRVVAEGSLLFPQQIVRVDRQTRRDLDENTKNKLLSLLREMIPQVDAVLLSDYRSGVISQEVVDICADVARNSRRIITVDSQGDLFKFKHFTVVKANQQETEAVLRVSLGSEEDYQEGGRQLLGRTMAEAVLITRGGDGMSLVQANGDYSHIQAANRSEVFDVTGAGDTVIAVLTLALAAGADLISSAQLANFAAGVVVRKLGNATLSSAELNAAVRVSETYEKGSRG